MVYKIAILLTYMITECVFCNGTKEFKCKARPGCHMARCDASQFGLDGLLERNEYPISCVHINASDKENCVTQNEYDKLLAEVKQLREGLQAVSSELELLQKNARETDLSINSSNVCRTSGNLPYDGKCYSIPQISSSYDLKYDAAKEKCRSVGSMLAEIHTFSQQEYLRLFVIAKKQGSVAELWIGMSFQDSSRTLRFRSGKEIPFDQLKWYPGHPGKFRGSAMAYSTHDISHAKHGVWNGNSGTLQGVICEKDL